MRRRLASGFAAAALACGGFGAALAQDNVDEVAQGHHIATLVCSPCHVAAKDQAFEPILRPPAPAFEALAQRSAVNEAFLHKFLTTTHRDISNPQGMPNPQLLDDQVQQVSAYLLSLRKKP